MCLPETAEVVRKRVEEDGLPRFDRRTALLAGAGAALTATLPGRALAAATPANRLQDLTHVFAESFPGFLGAPLQQTRTQLFTFAEHGYNGETWHFWLHTGTHMDAPLHFSLDGPGSDTIPVEQLLVPMVVVDIAQRAASDPDTVVTPDDLVRSERRHGRIPRHALVCMDSGWAARAGSAAAYRNVGADGLQHFPGFGLEAVQWLLAERDVVGIGVDTLSLDPGANTSFDVHYFWLGSGKYGLENLANLSRVPPRGATAFVGVVPWERGTGGPGRIVARW